MFWMTTVAHFASIIIIKIIIVLLSIIILSFIF